MVRLRDKLNYTTLFMKLFTGTTLTKVEANGYNLAVNVLEQLQKTDNVTISNINIWKKEFGKEYTISKTNITQALEYLTLHFNPGEDYYCDVKHQVFTGGDFKRHYIYLNLKHTDPPKNAFISMNKKARFWIKVDYNSQAALV